MNDLDQTVLLWRMGYLKARWWPAGKALLEGYHQAAFDPQWNLAIIVQDDALL